jgi:hypothetical protein
VAVSLYELGLVERAQGISGSAERRFQRALEIQELAIDPAHPFIALTLVELAEITQQRGETDRVRHLLHRALRAVRRVRSCVVHIGEIDRSLWGDRYVSSFPEPSANVISFGNVPLDIVVDNGD